MATEPRFEVQIYIQYRVTGFVNAFYINLGSVVTI
jgi:hypothetical protein